MDSFSSSWIIKPTESGSAQLSLPPQNRPPSPTLTIGGPRFAGPSPPRRREHFFSAHGHCCECEGNRYHDDVFPHFLKDYPPLPKDYPPPWTIFSQGNVPSRHVFDRRPRAHCSLPPHQYLTVNHGQSCRSRFITSIQRSFTEIAEESLPPPPHPEPYGHYSTHFPSGWLLSEASGRESQGNKRPLSSASFTSTDMGQPRFQPKSRPMPKPPLESTAAISQAKAPSPLPSDASKLPVELPIRNSTRQLVGAVATSVVPKVVASTSSDVDATTWSMEMARDGTAELKDEPPQVDKGEQIGIWVERVSRHGSFPSSTDNTLIMSLGAGLDEDTMAKVVGFDIDIDMDCSDASGLGDAPHVTPGMQENYSVYSESTNKAEQAAKDG